MENLREPRCHLVSWARVPTLYTQTQTFWSKLIVQFLVIYQLRVYTCKLYRLQKKSLLLIHWWSRRVAPYFRRLHQLKQSYCQTWMLIRLFLTMPLMIFACIFRPFEHLVRQTVIWSDVRPLYFRSCMAHWYNPHHAIILLVKL